MKGESKKRKERKQGRAKKGSKKPNTTIKHHDTEQMCSREQINIWKLSLLVQDTRQEKKSAIKQR